MLIEIDSGGNENSQMVILMRIPLLAMVSHYFLVWTEFKLLLISLLGNGCICGHKQV
jgi:hypothetical protein